MSKVFVDTNVLVYAADPGNPVRRERARDLLRGLLAGGQGVLSTQVLAEFYVTLTRKQGMDPLAAKALIRSYRNLETVVVTPAMIEDAIDVSILNALSFWDALIVVAAESARCAELWTEDLNPGQTIRGVRVVNPLHAPPKGRR